MYIIETLFTTNIHKPVHLNLPTGIPCVFSYVSEKKEKLTLGEHKTFYVEKFYILNVKLRNKFTFVLNTQQVIQSTMKNM